MHDQNGVITDYQLSTKKLFQAFFNQLKGEDPAEFTRCSLILSTGGMVQARTCMSPVGLIETSIEVTDAAGITVQIGRVEAGGVVNH